MFNSQISPKKIDLDIELPCQFSYECFHLFLQQQQTPMNVGGAGPGANMMTMNMQVSGIAFYLRNNYFCFVETIF